LTIFDEFPLVQVCVERRICEVSYDTCHLTHVIFCTFLLISSLSHQCGCPSVCPFVCHKLPAQI